MHFYYSVNKPYGMLSQFRREGSRQSLADLDFKFPPDVYPVGRLDAESEGLLILTNDVSLNNKLLDPLQGHPRKYLVQVEGEISDEAVKKLATGIPVRIKKSEIMTRPAIVERTDRPDNLPDRVPPVRYRKSIPTSWIYLQLTEGKYHQVRKMTAAAGFPTLRLVRISVSGIPLPSWIPGDVKKWRKLDFFKMLEPI